MKTSALTVLFLTIFFIPAYPMPSDPGGFLSPFFILLCSLFTFVALLLGRLKLRTSKLFQIYFFSFLFILIVEFWGMFNTDVLPEVQAQYLAGRMVLFFFFVAMIALLSTYVEIGEKTVLKALVWSAFFLSILIILEGFSVISIGNETRQGRMYFGIRLPFRKATGLPMSDGKLGTLLVPVFLIMLTTYTKQSMLFFSKIWKHLIFGTVLFGIIVSQSRSAWLGLVVALAIFLLFNQPKKLTYFKSLVYSVVLGGMIFLTILGAPSKILSGLVSEGIYANNVHNRLNGPLQVLQSVDGNLLLGNGKNVVKYVRESGTEAVVHNMFVDQLVASGILGFLPLVFIYTLPLFYLFKREYIEKGSKAQKVWIVASVAHCIVELSLYRGFYNEFAIIYLTLFVYYFGYRDKLLAKQFPS